MKYDMQYLGKRIKIEREKRGLTQEQLAEILDISPGFLGFIETEKRGISIEKLIDIANYFNITLDALLNINKDMPNYRQQLLIDLTKDIDNDKFDLLIKIAEAIK